MGHQCPPLALRIPAFIGPVCAVGDPDTCTPVGLPQCQPIEAGEDRDEAKQYKQRAAGLEAIGTREFKEDEMKQAL
jgi:hypothetical protein